MPKHLPGKDDESQENIYHGSRWQPIRNLTFRIQSRNEIHSNVSVVHKERERERPHVSQIYIASKSWISLTFHHLVLCLLYKHRITRSKAALNLG